MDKKEKTEVVFADSPEKIDGYSRPTIMANGKVMYVKCSKEFFEADRNYCRNEERQKDKCTRCRIFENGKWVMCTKNCQKEAIRLAEEGKEPCHRQPVASLDYLQEEYQLDFADDSEKSVQQRIFEQEVREHYEKIAAKLEPVERQVFELSFFDDKKDEEIALIIFHDKDQRRRAGEIKNEVTFYVIERLKAIYNK